MMQIHFDQEDKLAPYSGVILHIPHAATDIPPEFLEDYCISGAELEEEKHRLTDWYTDELFEFEDDAVEVVKFPYSRLLIDPERFRDDEHESMAKRGMGVLYTHGSELQPIRMNLSPERRQQLLAIYDEHHNRLEQAVQRALDRFGSALIIDCHSFPEHALPCHDFSSPCLIGIDLGTDAFHTPLPLLHYFGINLQRSNGWLVGFDQPFSGSIVPPRYYLKDSRVHSLMIEVNRSIYMDESTLQKKNKNFNRIQEQFKYLTQGCIVKG